MGHRSGDATLAEAEAIVAPFFSSYTQRALSLISIVLKFSFSPTVFLFSCGVSAANLVITIFPSPKHLGPLTFANWSMRRERSPTIELEDEIEINSATTTKADSLAPQAMFASFRGDLQSAFGGFNGQDLSHVTEGTRIALRHDAEGQLVWAFVPPAPHDEGVRDEGTWPRVVNVTG